MEFLNTPHAKSFDRPITVVAVTQLSEKCHPADSQHAIIDDGLGSRSNIVTYGNHPSDSNLQTQYATRTVVIVRCCSNLSTGLEK